ncbi:copper resistance protein CopC [Brevundimonas sp.]|uniref:copper resistance CopC family protein n=1 Tax=Brevundimonas sp. TaxID=1871086 RepID=UPI0024877E43|nr:copper resistance protein CopC [Brevundimonas sp.]MDI1280022.1 copper resistance protein CopC [Brevundimonas sp.]
MNRSFLAALAILVALAPVSLAQAQTNPHAGMSMQDHATMPAAPSSNSVTTTPADNAMLAAAPTAFSVTFPHAMTLTSLKLTGPAGLAMDVAVPGDASPATTVRAPLPAMAAGSYSAAWAAAGTDGHEMNGVVRFMVH